MRRSLAAVLCVLVASATVATAVPVGTLGVPAIRTATGDSTVSSVHIEEQTLRTDGSTVYEVFVLANSSSTIDLEINVTVSLETLDGTVVSDGSSSKLIGASGTERFAVDVSPNVTRAEFARFRVTVDS